MKKFLSFCVFFVLFMAACSSYGANLHTERWYQERWCSEQGGEVEVVLGDLTRVDCLLESHAFEFDFAKKWAEAIGQSLHYAHMTNRQPGIVLIVEDLSDLKHLNKLLRTNEATDLNILILTDTE